MAVSGLLDRGVPPFPRYLLYIKGGILFLSVIVLILAAYSTSVQGDVPAEYSSGVPGYLIFLVRSLNGL